MLGYSVTLPLTGVIYFPKGEMSCYPRSNFHHWKCPYFRQKLCACANWCLIKATTKSQMTQSGKKGKDQNNTGKYFPDMPPYLYAMLENSLIPPKIFKKDTRKICLLKILPGFYKVQLFL